MTLTAASPVNIGSHRFIRLGDAASNVLKNPLPANEISGAPQGQAGVH
jgi:hypothetical protein